MTSSPRVFVRFVVILAVMTLLLDIVTNVVPDLLPASLTQDPIVVGLLLGGLLLIVIILTLGLRAAEFNGDDTYVSPEVLKLFAAFAGIAVGVAVGLVSTPTIVDFGLRAVEQTYDYFTPATIRLEPLSGPPGTSITVTGKHFARDTPVVISITNRPVGNVRTDEDGAFVFAFKLPKFNENQAQTNQLLEVSADDEDAKGYATAIVLLEA